MGENCDPKLTIRGGDFSADIRLAPYDADKEGLKAALVTELTGAAKAVLGTGEPEITVVQSCEVCDTTKDLLTAKLDDKAVAAYRKRHEDVDDETLAEGIARILADRVMHMLFCHSIIIMIFG